MGGNGQSLFWIFSRAVDFLTGYVEYSFLRVIFAILLSLVMIFSLVNGMPNYLSKIMNAALSGSGVE